MTSEPGLGLSTKTVTFRFSTRLFFAFRSIYRINRPAFPESSSETSPRIDTRHDSHIDKAKLVLCKW